METKLDPKQLCQEEAENLLKGVIGKAQDERNRSSLQKDLEKSIESFRYSNLTGEELSEIGNELKDLAVEIRQKYHLRRIFCVYLPTFTGFFKRIQARQLDEAGSRLILLSAEK